MNVVADRVLQGKVAALRLEIEEGRKVMRLALQYLLLVRDVDQGHSTYNGDLDGVIENVQKATSRKAEI